MQLVKRPDSLWKCLLTSVFISFAYLNYKPNDGFVWFQRKIQNVVVRDAQAQKETLNLNSDFYAALLPYTTSEGYGYVSPSGIED